MKCQKCGYVSPAVKKQTQVMEDIISLIFQQGDKDKIRELIIKEMPWLADTLVKGVKCTSCKKILQEPSGNKKRYVEGLCKICDFSRRNINGMIRDK